MKNTVTSFSFYLLFFIISLFLSHSVYSQTILEPELSKNNGKPLTLFELQSNFNKKWEAKNIDNGYYFENGQKTKAPGWKIFKREEWFWEQRVDLNTGEFPQTNAAFEYEKVKNSLAKSNFTENWTNLGTSSSAGGYAGIGRINCVAFHPTDANTFWVGSPSGGLWRTTDGGSSWTIINSSMTTLGVSDIAITSDYATSNTLYIATGDRDGGSLWSLGGSQAADNVTVGIYKSTDGGSTWSATGLTFSKGSGTRLMRLLIHPTNNAILFASVHSSDANVRGIYKSTDNGVNWLRKTANSWADVEFKPGSPDVMYASSFPFAGTYVNISTNGGENWSFNLITSSGRRGELAVSPADVNVVYLLAANSTGGVDGVYKSTNSGTSFSKINANSVTEPGMLGYFTDGRGPATGQGSYDLCIAVDPSNASTVYIGGITTWKSSNGGVDWAPISCWTAGSGPPPYDYNTSSAPVVHADKHALAFQSAGVLFEGNDGGIYKTTNGGTSWTDLSNGLVISQLYRIGVSQTNMNTVLTGLQDNGSKLYNSTWSDVKGGDGMECIIDYSNSNYMYATYVRGQISRSTNGGMTFPTDITANINTSPTPDPVGAWVTPYVIHPTNPAILIAGFDQVWKTTSRGDAGSWTAISNVLSASTKLRSLAISKSNPLVMYTADQANMWKTTDGGATLAWTSIASLPGFPSLSNAITYITIHPTDPNTLWFTVGGYTSGQKVFESTNGGTTWTNISTGLPNLPVMSIVHYKKATDRNVLFVGTDLGVYVKDGTNAWAPYNNGLPNVVVTEIEVFYNSSGADKLRAGTYGRGLWETDIDAALPVELATFTVNSIKGASASIEWETTTEVNNYGFEIERSHVSNALASDQNWEKIGFVKGHGNSNSSKFYSFVDNNIDGGNKFAYRLKQLDVDGQFDYSDVVEISIIPTEFVLEQNYPNPFNPSTKISYRLPVRSEVKLTIYNVLGKEVRRLLNEVKEAGLYSVEFDASNLPSGVYYYSLSANDFNMTKKMMFVK